MNYNKETMRKDLTDRINLSRDRVDLSIVIRMFHSYLKLIISGYGIESAKFEYNIIDKLILQQRTKIILSE